MPSRYVIIYCLFIEATIVIQAAIVVEFVLLFFRAS